MVTVIENLQVDDFVAKKQRGSTKMLLQCVHLKLSVFFCLLTCLKLSNMIIDWYQNILGIDKF